MWYTMVMSISMSSGGCRCGCVCVLFVSVKLVKSVLFFDMSKWCVEDLFSLIFLFFVVSFFLFRFLVARDCVNFFFFCYLLRYHFRFYPCYSS